MAEQNPQDQGEQQGELTEEQVAQVQEIATEAVRTALAQAAREANMTPSDRLRDAYKPAA
jgi:hypothetical protein